MKRQRFSALAAALLAVAMLLASCGPRTPPPEVSGAPEPSSPSSEISGAPEAPASSDSSDGSGVAGVSVTSLSSDGSGAATSGLFPQASLDELNQAWNRLSDSTDTVFENAFSMGFSYCSCESYEVYWTSSQGGYNCILLREKANGKWRQIELGKFDNVVVDGMSCDPLALTISLSGMTYFPDGGFHDFMRDLTYDVTTGKLSVTKYYNDDTGWFGGSSWVNHTFSSVKMGPDSVELRFKSLPEFENQNGYRSPVIGIFQDEEEKYPRKNYILRFDHVEQNLTPEQLAAIAALPGVDSLRADYYDDSCFSGTAWSIRLKDGYKLLFFFENDGSMEEYSSFRIQAVPIQKRH